METWSWNENNRVWRTGKSLSKTISMNGSSWTSWFNYLIIHIQWGTDLFKNMNHQTCHPLTFWTPVSSASLTPLGRCTKNGPTWHTAIVLLNLPVTCQPGKIFIYLVKWPEKIQILAGDGHDSGVQTNNSRPSSTCRGVGLIQGTSVYCDWVHSIGPPGIGRSER